MSWKVAVPVLLGILGIALILSGFGGLPAQSKNGRLIIEFWPLVRLVAGHVVLYVAGQAWAAHRP